MRKNRFSDEQMVAILREADRTSVAEATKKGKISEQATGDLPSKRHASATFRRAGGVLHDEELATPTNRCDLPSVGATEVWTSHSSVDKPSPQSAHETSELQPWAPTLGSDPTAKPEQLHPDGVANAASAPWRRSRVRVRPQYDLERGALLRGALNRQHGPDQLGLLAQPGKNVMPRMRRLRIEADAIVGDDQHQAVAIGRHSQRDGDARRPRVAFDVAHRFFGDPEQRLGAFVGECARRRIARVVDRNAGAFHKQLDMIAPRCGKSGVAHRAEAHLCDRGAGFLQALMRCFLGTPQFLRNGGRFGGRQPLQEPDLRSIAIIEWASVSCRSRAIIPSSESTPDGECGGALAGRAAGRRQPAPRSAFSERIDSLGDPDRIRYLDLILGTSIYAVA